MGKSLPMPEGPPVDYVPRPQFQPFMSAISGTQ
jgi:hypothetical protein